MVPEIVASKIYWYEWRIKQRELCNEYKYKFLINDDRNINDYGLVMRGKKSLMFYNYRYIADCWSHFGVRNSKHEKVDKLSKNY